MESTVRNRNLAAAVLLDIQPYHFSNFWISVRIRIRSIIISALQMHLIRQIQATSSFLDTMYHITTAVGLPSHPHKTKIRRSDYGSLLKCPCLNIPVLEYPHIHSPVPYPQPSLTFHHRVTTYKINFTKYIRFYFPRASASSRLIPDQPLNSITPLTLTSPPQKRGETDIF